MTADTELTIPKKNTSILHNSRRFVSWFRRSFIPNERRKQNESNLL